MGGWPSHRRSTVRLGTALSATGLAALVVGCGSSALAARPAVCRLKAQQALATDLRIAPDGVAYARAEGNNAMPQCVFRAHTARRAVVVTVNVDNGPQPYFRLLRTVTEAAQIFGVPPPGFHPPQGLSGLGPYASWFPNEHHLMATNDRVLLTVTVNWPGATRAEEVALARGATVPYLVRPRGPVNTNDFP